MPRPELPTHAAALDRICAYCQSYVFRRREDPGWAFCKRKNEFFPGQGPELPSETIPSNKRDDITYYTFNELLPEYKFNFERFAEGLMIPNLPGSQRRIGGEEK